MTLAHNLPRKMRFPTMLGLFSNSVRRKNMKTVNVDKIVTISAASKQAAKQVIYEECHDMYKNPSYDNEIVFSNATLIDVNSNQDIDTAASAYRWKRVADGSGQRINDRTLSNVLENHMKEPLNKVFEPFKSLKISPPLKTYKITSFIRIQDRETNTMYYFKPVPIYDDITFNVYVSKKTRSDDIQGKFQEQVAKIRDLRGSQSTAHRVDSARVVVSIAADIKHPPAIARKVRLRFSYTIKGRRSYSETSR